MWPSWPFCFRWPKALPATSSQQLRPQQLRPSNFAPATLFYIIHVYILYVCIILCVFSLFGGWPQAAPPWCAAPSEGGCAKVCGPSQLLEVGASHPLGDTRSVAPRQPADGFQQSAWRTHASELPTANQLLRLVHSWWIRRSFRMVMLEASDVGSM